MELQTTVKDFPNKVISLNIPPDTPIRVIIEANEMPEQKNEASDEATEKKGRWAKAIERLSQEDSLKGLSEEVNKLAREFRDNFSF
ncbi:MAG: hypothetical protein HQK60_11250 [Deltaproteobacteria bacterium]|nr:hypothetical protein [Deltaproteobacteria bacterium]